MSFILKLAVYDINMVMVFHRIELDNLITITSTNINGNVIPILCVSVFYMTYSCLFFSDNGTDTCEDKHKSHYCQYWAEEGECEKSADWMKDNCRLSCKYCESGKPESKSMHLK